MAPLTKIGKAIAAVSATSPEVAGDQCESEQPEADDEHLVRCDQASDDHAPYCGEWCGYVPAGFPRLDAQHQE